jgi:hypothetical protein
MEKLLALETGLGTLRTQRKTTIDASKVTCETTAAKNESKGSSSLNGYFTEHLISEFKNPTRECNENPESSSL